MKLPKSFNDITVSQFQECYFLLGKEPQIEDWIKVISVLGGVTEKYLYEIPSWKLKAYVKWLGFLMTPELNEKVNKYIVLNGTVYKAVFNATDLNTAQAIDLRTFMKPSGGSSQQDVIIENLDKLLASLYLPLKWFRFQYDGANHSKICKDFQSAKLGQVYGTLFFYSRVWDLLMKDMERSGKEAQKILIPHMKEVEEWAKSSGIIGDGK